MRGQIKNIHMSWLIGQKHRPKQSHHRQEHHYDNPQQLQMQFSSIFFLRLSKQPQNQHAVFQTSNPTCFKGLPKLGKLKDCQPEHKKMSVRVMLCSSGKVLKPSEKQCTQLTPQYHHSQNPKMPAEDVNKRTIVFF